MENSLLEWLIDCISRVSFHWRIPSTHLLGYTSSSDVNYDISVAI